MRSCHRSLCVFVASAAPSPTLWSLQMKGWRGRGQRGSKMRGEMCRYSCDGGHDLWRVNLFPVEERIALLGHLIAHLWHGATAGAIAGLWERLAGQKLRLAASPHTEAACWFRCNTMCVSNLLHSSLKYLEEVVTLFRHKLQHIFCRILCDRPIKYTS